MVLLAGVNKANGLAAALALLRYATARTSNSRLRLGGA
jgi:hypothetical protein